MPLVRAVEGGGDQREDDGSRDRRVRPLRRAELADESAAEDEDDTEDDEKDEGEAEVRARPALLGCTSMSALGQKTSSGYRGGLTWQALGA